MHSRQKNIRRKYERRNNNRTLTSFMSLQLANCQLQTSPLGYHDSIQPLVPQDQSTDASVNNKKPLLSTKRIDGRSLISLQISQHFWNIRLLGPTWRTKRENPISDCSDVMRLCHLRGLWVGFRTQKNF